MLILHCHSFHGKKEMFPNSSHQKLEKNLFTLISWQNCRHDYSPASPRDRIQENMTMSSIILWWKMESRVFYGIAALRTNLVQPITELNGSMVTWKFIGKWINLLHIVPFDTNIQSTKVKNGFINNRLSATTKLIPSFLKYLWKIFLNLLLRIYR